MEPHMTCPNCDELRERLAASEKDAGRYRFLREGETKVAICTSDNYRQDWVAITHSWDGEHGARKEGRKILTGADADAFVDSGMMLLQVAGSP